MWKKAANLYAVINLAFLVASAVSENKANCAAKIAACEKNMAGKRAVCGTDNKTYPTRCNLLRTHCQGFPVSVKHRGPCTSNAQPCPVTRKYALSMRKGAATREGNNAFVPRCRGDGSYAAIQCHGDTGCWCVTPTGKALKNTSVRNGRPNCSDTGKSFTTRRSSQRVLRNRKICTKGDKNQFNLNMVKIFKTEYERGSPLPADKEPNRFVLEWKFGELDKNGNGALEKSEYRGLRRLVKKVVKPKKCARSFTKVCDMNHDEIITKQEWVSCLSGDGLNFEHGAEDKQTVKEEDEDYNMEEEPSSVLPGSLMKVQLPELEGPMERTREDTDTNDCLTDRKIVLDEQKNGDVLYVPECTSDGRYQRVQCYHSVGYCWCVHEDTGKPIPGSSVKDKRPQCDSMPSLHRPMKGCPEPSKTKFLKDLLGFLTMKMTAASNGSTTGTADIPKWQASREEQVATWAFVMLDKDKNKALERREWKSFHTLISGNSQLKKCGRKLPRYCDVNHDRRISITEWLACLDAQKSVPEVASTIQPPVSTQAQRRKGPNPLESILKADD